MGHPRHRWHRNQWALLTLPLPSSQLTCLAFSKDLLTNPSIRGVSDIRHTIVAAASSSSLSRAQEFLSVVGAPKTATAYGSYHDLCKDANIDVIYVATPHSHHFQNAMLALSHGKNVLCEKAFTVNAAQAKKLVATAEAKGLFLMEAVWTRYFPLSIQIRDHVKNGKIGVVHRVLSDLSISTALPNGDLDFPDDSRMVDKQLAGGALLDLGIYALTWVFQILYHCQPAGSREKPSVHSAMNLYKTGADEMTSMILRFEKSKSMGIATTSMRVDGQSSDFPQIRIQGTQGEIQVYGPAYRPTKYAIVGKDGKREEVECEIPKEGEKGVGHGMFWEADEAGRCVRDGKKESEGLGWAESVVIMETMDEVRRQGGLVYGKEIETDVYDEKSPLNG